jgi:GNAT superfamily N-acetyltransferase
MQVTIRNAELKDLDALIHLLQQLFAIESDFEFDLGRHQSGLSLMLDGCLKHKCIKVAEAGGRVVGMCTAQLLISTAEGGIVALIEDVVVDKSLRGRGIGARLLHSIEQWAHSRGATRLQLLADCDNHAALTFYEKTGWQRTQLICVRKKR